tara:strand:- start:5653 stop:5979 length:327 start_codon:yes stop_codon:yes gene_type:complete
MEPTIQTDLFNEIQKNLFTRFNRKFSLPKKEPENLVSREEMAFELYNWYTFWKTERPDLNDPNITITEKNITLFMKAQICDSYIMRVYETIKYQGLLEDFQKLCDEAC